MALNKLKFNSINVTAAIDGAQFKFSSGNIDSGTIKLYGVS